LSSSLGNPRPDNALRIVREGIHPVAGGAGAVMPGFADALTDAQVVALMSYLRSTFTDHAPWPGVEEALRRVKKDDSRQRNAQRARVSP